MTRRKSKSATWGRTPLAMSALILSATVAIAGPHRMSNDLEARRDSGNVDVIVQFNHEPADNDHQRVANHGGQLKRKLGHFRGAVYTVSASRLTELASDPNVAYVSPDRPITGAGANASAWVLDFRNEAINAPAAWQQGLDGTGIGVAVIDSGIANVPDMHSKKKRAAAMLSSARTSQATLRAALPTSTGTARMSAGSLRGLGPNPADPITSTVFRASPVTRTLLIFACSTRTDQAQTARLSRLFKLQFN